MTSISSSSRPSLPRAYIPRCNYTGGSETIHKDIAKSAEILARFSSHGKLAEEQGDHAEKQWNAMLPHLQCNLCKRIATDYCSEWKNPWLFFPNRGNGRGSVAICPECFKQPLFTFQPHMYTVGFLNVEMVDTSDEFVRRENQHGLIVENFLQTLESDPAASPELFLQGCREKRCNDIMAPGKRAVGRMEPTISSPLKRRKFVKPDKKQTLPSLSIPPHH